MLKRNLEPFGLLYFIENFNPSLVKQHHILSKQVELYKINSNQTESRVKQKIHLYDRVSANRTFMLLSVPKEYGQYRLKITVLGD